MRATPGKLEWLLRIALCGEFLGHGWYAFTGDGHFVNLLVNTTGISVVWAPTVLVAIGLIDFAVAGCALFKPMRAILIYAAVWGFLTALARPVAGLEVWAFVERWPNFGIPLALLWVREMPRFRSAGFAH